MNYSTLNQKGSPSRDKFKLLHKQQLSGYFYALDSDLELVEKFPYPFVVARLDFKWGNDTVGFTEAIAYQQYIKTPAPYNIPVFLVYASDNFMDDEIGPEHHRFNIYQLLNANYSPDPPHVELYLCREDLSWDGLGQWEKNLRISRKDQIDRYISNNNITWHDTQEWERVYPNDGAMVRMYEKGHPK